MLISTFHLTNQMLTFIPKVGYNKSFNISATKPRRIERRRTQKRGSEVKETDNPRQGLGEGHGVPITVYLTSTGSTQWQ